MRLRDLALGVAAAGLVIVMAAPMVQAGPTPEVLIKMAVRRWWPEPYRSHPDLFVAQCWCESRLKADAVSPVGAVGLCQVMPATAADLLSRGGARGKLRGNLRGQLRNAKTNAELGARYMGKMFRFWSWNRTDECRWGVSVPSYNAGPGNVRDSQTEAGGALCWPEISPHMYKVTGEHSKETIGYEKCVRKEYLRRVQQKRGR